MPVKIDEPMAREELDAYAARAVEHYIESEAQRRKRRQAEGIAAAKARGVKFGRPESEARVGFDLVAEEWENKRIPLETALRLCGLSQATFFRRLKRHRRECGIED